MRTATRKLALVVSAVLTLAAVGGVALAQVPPAPPAPPAPPPPMEMAQHGKHGDPEARAKHLRDVLQLRPDQDAALKAYLDATSPKAMMESIKHDDEDGAMDGKKTLTTPERLDRQAAHMTKMAETFQKRASATKAFYAALTPSQRKAFDALGPEAGGPRMIVRHIETRHDGPPMGEGKEDRTVIMKRKPS